MHNENSRPQRPAIGRKPPSALWGRLRQVCGLLTVIAVMMAVAVQRDGRLLGRNLASPTEDVDATPAPRPAAGEATAAPTVIHTAELAGDIIGYAGPTPLTITLIDGHISEVRAEPNSETPSFFQSVEAILLGKWVGMTPREALAAEVDAVSGATFSSNAVIQNVRLAMQTLAGQEAASSPAWPAWLTPKFVCTLVVILLGALLPLVSWTSRNLQKGLRWAQLALNVGVLGLWSGTFLSCTSIVGLFSNGLHSPAAWVTLLLLIVAFIYPLFGRGKHYCGHLCPLGSLQELAGLTRRRKWRLSPRLTQRLTRFREVLWAVLMLLMWSGLWLRWMDYELFVAFLFQQASPVVIGVAVVFVLLSVFVPRPYCRFICPTGQLMKVVSNKGKA